MVMSLASKTTLNLACLATLGTITYVHYKQKADQKKLHEGILKDLERQEKRKMEKMYWLERQLEATKILIKEQSEKGNVTIPVLQDLSK